MHIPPRFHEVRGHRRMRVSLAPGTTIDAAPLKAEEMTKILHEGTRQG